VERIGEELMRFFFFLASTSGIKVVFREKLLRFGSELLQDRARFPKK